MGFFIGAPKAARGLAWTRVLGLFLLRSIPGFFRLQVGLGPYCQETTPSEQMAGMVPTAELRSIGKW